jgi:hypothetical protein
MRILARTWHVVGVRGSVEDMVSAIKRVKRISTSSPLIWVNHIVSVAALKDLSWAYIEYCHS